jgi:hypothetical protein
VTPGFNIDSLSPTDLVEVRVERVYRNRTAVALREGVTLRYQTRGGSLRIGGIDFCVKAEGDLAAQAGDLVLVLGTIDERLADYIYPDNPFGVLAVTAAKTVLLPSDRGEPETAMPLSDVPRNLDRLAPDQRRQAVTQ